MNGEGPQAGTKPLIVGIGGTLRASSSSERALRRCLSIAEAAGAATAIFTGADLRMPLYEPGSPSLSPACEKMITALRAADGIILASPGYHGSISGTLKNALDYTEEMRGDARIYFDGRAVGCIASAAGWQAAAATLSALRSITHALRGWPTPLGIMMNSSEPIFDAEGAPVSASLDDNFALMTQQVLAFARRSILAQGV
jgi:FMN reductase